MKDYQKIKRMFSDYLVEETLISILCCMPDETYHILTFQNPDTGEFLTFEFNCAGKLKAIK